MAFGTEITNVSPALIYQVSGHNVGTVAANIQPTQLREGVIWISYDLPACNTIWLGIRDDQSCCALTISTGHLFHETDHRVSFWGVSSKVLFFVNQNITIHHRSMIPQINRYVDLFIVNKKN